MADAPSIRQIEQLVAIAEAFELEELSVSDAELTVSVRGFQVYAEQPQAPGAETAQPVLGHVRVAPRLPKQPSQSDQISKDVPLTSPMTGIFYRASSPDAPSFVEEGDEVVLGQTIGLIEAMKVFSEIPAERAGRITRIVAANGKLVNADDTIMYIEPESGSGVLPEE